MRGFVMVPEADREEVRLALVMDGGSSLAIWIGGVGREAQRLCVTETMDLSTGYGALLAFTQSKARIDVMAGTSAGGLNGAFLAVALARGSDLGPLADLWAREGSLKRLLRPPLEGDPASLLRGDEYFLPALREALQQIWDRGHNPPPADEMPLHLIMTTTSIAGRPMPYVDDFGNRLEEISHLALFRFQRAPGLEDPFGDQQVVGRLALAARSTASFPGAFEPSWLPFGKDLDGLHPDMTKVTELRHSGFVLDGGVLMNRPIQPALEAIFEQGAVGQVRRALLFVEPDPGGPLAIAEESPDKPPSLRSVLLDSLVTLPRVESVTNSLDELAAHNAKVRERRDLRVALVDIVGRGSSGQLEGLAAWLFDVYVSQRRNHVLTGLTHGTRAGAARHADLDVPWWSDTELEAAFDEVWLPLVPTPGTPLEDAPLAALGAGFAQRLSFTAIDLLKRALYAAPLLRHEAATLTDVAVPAGAGDDPREDIRLLRRRLYEVVPRVQALVEREEEIWQALVATLPTPGKDAAERMEQLRLALTMSMAPDQPVGRLVVALTESLTAVVNDLLGVLEQAWPVLRRILDDVERDEPEIRGIETKARKLRNLVKVVYGSTEQPPAAEELETRQCRLDVLFVLMAPHVEVEQLVQLLQVTGHTPNAFDGPTEIGRKVTGTRTGHFAAFYKPSWRVNDWIWGRLDGAMRLSQVMLDPGRLRQLGYGSQRALELLREISLPPAGDPPTDRERADRAYLGRCFDAAAEACARELSYLDTHELPVPPGLPVCATQVARRIQAEILREELPRLAAAVDEDDAEGALGDGEGPRFRRAFAHALRGVKGGLPQDLTAEQLFTLFRDCGIGAEEIADDAGSDLFAQTVSQAGLVGVSMTEGSGSGLLPLRVVTRPLRALMLVLYVLVTGATRSGAFGRALVSFMLAAGGALLAVAALDEGAPKLVAVAGGVLALAGVGLAALRSRSWPLVVASGLGLAGLVLLAFLLNQPPPAVTPGGPAAAPAGGARPGQVGWTIGVLIAATWMVGMVRQPRRLPWLLTGPWWSRLALLAIGLFGTVRLAAWLPQVESCTAPPGLLAKVGHFFNCGIVDLEFAATPARAAAVMARFDVPAALLNVQRDYAFLLVYWLPLSAACALAALAVRRLSRSRAALGWARGAVLAAWAPIVAVAFDAIENVGMLVMLQAARDETVATLSPVVPALTALLAAVKFALLGGTAAFLVLLVVVLPLLRAGAAVLRRVRERRRARAAAA